jgi:hypothetical protein
LKFTEDEVVEEVMVEKTGTFTNSFEIKEEEKEDAVTSLGKNLFGDLFNKG